MTDPIRWSAAPKLALWGAEYEGDGRQYVDPFTGMRYPSITSVLKNTPKADLMGWSALKVAERARDRPDIVMGDPDKVVQRLQYAHNDFRDERGWVGSGVHAAIQAEHQGNWDFPWDSLTPEQEGMIHQFHEFSDVYSLEIVHSEVTLLNEALGLMGTADAIATWVDPITQEKQSGVVDWKTSKSVWPEHEMQVAALRGANYMFTELPPDAACLPGDAALRKGKTRAEDSWWIRTPVTPHGDAAILHLSEKTWSFDVLDPELLDLREKQIGLYADLHRLNQDIKSGGWKPL